MTPIPRPPVSFDDLIAAGKIRRRPVATLTPFDPKSIDFDKLHRDRAAMLDRAGRHKPPITRILPVPRAILLGTGTFVVAEMRLRHLAELQAFLEESEPNPMDAIPPPWADPDPETRVSRLAQAWEAAASWPPRLGTARGSKILGSPRGRIAFLAMILREHQPDFALADALALIGDITSIQWARLERIAWALHPRLEIAAELAPSRSPGQPVDWCQSVHLVLGDVAALGFEGLGELSLSQWRNLCAGGKAIEFGPDYSLACKKVREVLDQENIDG